MSSENDRTEGTEPAWVLVTRREVVSRITDKSFLIGTVLMVALLVGFIGFSAWQDERTETVTLGATPDAVAMATAIADGGPEAAGQWLRELRGALDTADGGGAGVFGAGG